MNRLYSADPTQELTRYWGGQSTCTAIQTAITQVVQMGEKLPPTFFAGGKVYPVVIWNHGALEQRLCDGPKPLRNPSAVQDLLAQPYGTVSTPSVLRMIAFLSPSPLIQARRELSGLRTMGRTIAVLPMERRVSKFTLMEFDLLGTTVIRADANEAQVLVGGDPGIRQGCEINPVWARFHEEQLFAWAVDSDALPKIPKIMAV